MVVDGLKKGNFYKIKKSLKTSLPGSRPHSKGRRKDTSTPSAPDTKRYTKLNNELLKELVLKMLNGELTQEEERRLKIAIDFVKGIKVDAIEMEELDMEGFILEIKK